MGKAKKSVAPSYHCPLINKTVCVGLCYDIQMIRGKSIKKEILDFELDFEKGDELCSECPFNQLPGVRKGMWNK